MAHNKAHPPDWHRFSRGGVEHRVCNKCGLVEKRVHGQWRTVRGSTIPDDEVER